MTTADDLRALRDAFDDARDEVAYYCERDGACPAHVLAHAEALQRALAESADVPPAYAEAI